MRRASGSTEGAFLPLPLAGEGRGEGYSVTNSAVLNFIANQEVRRYYRATAKGRAALEQLKERIRELTAEVLDDDRSAGGSGR